jgi:DNA-binding transcriptional regulator YiaG
MTIIEIRALSGLDKAKFARYYNIPYRTLQDWENGKSKPPIYVLPLLERCVKEDFAHNFAHEAL